MVGERAIICVGNRSRSDDGIGPLIAEELLSRNLDVPVHFSNGEPGELLDLWRGLDRAVMVDAVLTGRSEPGTVQVLRAGDEPLPVISHASSHGIGLAESIELARSLRALPADVRLVGIEAESLEPGSELTPAVRAAIPDAIEQILTEAGDA
ncbi:MAG: hydrogenase maturation protease [Acidimicrobiia bacterium]|nr:hydrogenase maturation protease [Acidimicrobiia bacterium]NNF88195.1 hydrogenase maturation protease [Acidimicrobiia bacterium]NNL14281.1 hydrogenase maturation protease [Acidimicrobiia bacterium]RZV44879.1 MAG: hydrogenase maturation protease [Acidimicrobiia bacterium]